jgi:hypothetical protein
MPRHRLSLEEQLKGVEKAIKSKRTKPWLKESMRRFARKLREQIAAESHSRPEKPRHSFF